MGVWEYKTCVYTHNVRTRAHMCVHGVSCSHTPIFVFSSIISYEYLPREMGVYGSMKNDIFFLQ